TGHLRRDRVGADQSIGGNGGIALHQRLFGPDAGVTARLGAQCLGAYLRSGHQRTRRHAERLWIGSRASSAPGTAQFRSACPDPVDAAAHDWHNDRELLTMTNKTGAATLESSVRAVSSIAGTVTHLNTAAEGHIEIQDL